MSDLDTALAAIRREDDPNRKNLRVIAADRDEMLRVADSPGYRVGAELRAMLGEESSKGDAVG